jgi:molecular chaperone HscA
MVTLLNIEEKSTSNTKRTEIAIGIDLGTTNSAVAIWRNGKPEILEDDLGKIFVPSIVDTGDTLLRSTKRMMDEPLTKIHNEYSALVCATEILKNLKTRAEKALDQKITKAVITVPAYFEDTARQATKDAAALAGLEVLRLINEPTAAALAYGLDHGHEGKFVIYDLGGGTFDVSILSLRKGVFQVLATAGNTKLGGDDIDTAISNYFNWNDSLKAKLAKENLNNGVTTELLAKIAKPYIDSTLQICAQAINDAKLSTSEIDGVVLVGGSTKMAPVKDAVRDFFQKEPLTNLDPDLVVAYGAALQAHQLTGSVDTILLDVIPISLGIETMAGMFEKIIPRNSPIPIRMAQDFTTSQNGQTAISIHVLQGEREFVKDCRSLAQFNLNGIPPMLAGAARVRVTFTVDADGLLTVTANELSTNTSQEIAVKPTYGLTTDDFATMLSNAYAHAKDDMEQRLLIASTLKAKQILEQLANALTVDAHLLSNAEIQTLNEHSQTLRDALKSNKRELIDEKCKNLMETAQVFAEKRLNNAIKDKLNLKTID